MIRPFQTPIVRYFIGWMLFLTAFYYLLIQLTASDGAEITSSAADLLTQIVALLPLFWFLFKSLDHTLPIRYFGRQEVDPFRWSSLLGFTLAWIVFAIGLDGAFAYGLSWIAPQYLLEADNVKLFSESDTLVTTLLTVLLAGIIAPTMEELVFRGLLLQRFIIKYGISSAIVGSSVLFGLLHMEGWLGASVFAIFMCLVYLRTRNLWAIVLLHILNNMAALTFEFVQSKQSNMLNMSELRADWAFSMLGLLVLPFILKFYRQHWPKQPVELPYYFNQMNST